MRTIYALASARGRAGVAVIRTSGPCAIDGLLSIVGQAELPYRQALLKTLYHPVSRETLDKALVIAFKGPHSFTGEDCAEYHIHGGVAVIQSVLAALSILPDHRLAEPGEFTRRAFENGKMDLTEAEGLADLINAETELQKQQAMAQMGGVLHHLYDEWKDRLARILAYVEADLEFPDEDMPEGILPRMLPQISALEVEIRAHLSDNRRGERLREGFQIAIVGAPNAGKSSLVNLLARRNVAIVSEVAGTTRDVIEAHLDIGGYPVIMSDTAGLRPDALGDEGHDLIESEGIRRAYERAKAADLTILLYDASSETVDQHTKALAAGAHILNVVNKCDKPIKLSIDQIDAKISVATGEGVDHLLGQIIKKIEQLMGKSESPALTRERHRVALSDCVSSLGRALSAPLPELAAEDLRLAIRDLGRLTGKVDVEDLLDIVFRDFCIGK